MLGTFFCIGRGAAPPLFFSSPQGHLATTSNRASKCTFTFHLRNKRMTLVFCPRFFLLTVSPLPSRGVGAAVMQRFAPVKKA